MGRNLFVIGILALAACGGGSSGNHSGGGNSVSGPIKGMTITPADAVSAVVSENNGTVQLASIAITEWSGTCALITTSHTQHPNAHILIIQAGTIDQAGNVTAPTSAGTFQVTSKATMPGPFAAVEFLGTDSMCKSSNTASGVSGTVTFTAAGSAGYTGTADVTFDSGDHVTVKFDSKDCAGLGANTTEPTCM